jgi:hypothetical protein
MIDECLEFGAVFITPSFLLNDVFFLFGLPKISIYPFKFPYYPQIQAHNFQIKPNKKKKKKPSFLGPSKGISGLQSLKCMPFESFHYCSMEREYCLFSIGKEPKKFLIK